MSLILQISSSDADSESCRNRKEYAANTTQGDRHSTMYWTKWAKEDNIVYY